MVKKNSFHEEKLKKLVRSMVQEELDRIHNGGMEEPIFEPEGWQKPKQEPMPSNANIPPDEPDLFWEPDDDWAFFGSPEPNEPQNAKIKQQRPRALPGWVEPLRPNNQALSTPFLPKKRKK
ncbi:hypothetical protein [Risungbinella massiliensis]|uniref:hypothetical protein n=1 Tax=Risungbinella massiliensis TaxID=1329796 RepID=UPI0005CC6A50|nr:hypothetical protein [Risungbinella massiliensis]